MRKIRDILRLKHENKLANRQIAKSLSVPKSTVADHLTRARMAGLKWPLPDDVDETTLERLLFPPPPSASVQRPMPETPGHRSREIPDMRLLGGGHLGWMGVERGICPPPGSSSPV